jgi:hypothetical protein
MSIPGRNSTAAMLVRTAFVVVLVLVNVPGFRLVLARGWHDQLRVRGSWDSSDQRQDRVNGFSLSARQSICLQSPRAGSATAASLGINPLQICLNRLLSGLVV